MRRVRVHFKARPPGVITGIESPQTSIVSFSKTQFRAHFFIMVLSRSCGWKEDQMERNAIRIRLKASRRADAVIDIGRRVDRSDPAGFSLVAWRLKRKRTVSALCVKVELEQEALLLSQDCL
jgi:hypothetical protein